MAKKNGKKWNAPAGFTPVSSRLAGFFVRREGNAIQGTLRGTFQTEGKFGDRDVYKIEVTDGETAIMDKEDGERMAAIGEIVGVDHVGYLTCLAELEKGREVALYCAGKSGTDREDPWIFEVAVKPE